jgi:hypothetical protein
MKDRYHEGYADGKLMQSVANKGEIERLKVLLLGYLCNCGQLSLDPMQHADATTRGIGHQWQHAACGYRAAMTAKSPGFVIIDEASNVPDAAWSAEFEPLPSTHLTKT